MSLYFFAKTASEPIVSGGAKRGRPKIGIALGGGVARGWAHIGALRELIALGVTPDIVAGASIGAVVGGCFAAGRLDTLETFARSLTRRTVFSLLDISFNGGGLIGGGRLRARLNAAMGPLRIEELPIPFVCVATEIGTGHEIWLKRGALVEAMCASYALPGVFEPVRMGGRWLFDGAIVNPVPVSVARAFGAEIVIALGIGDGSGRGTAIQDLEYTEEEAAIPTPAAPLARRGARIGGLLPRFWTSEVSDAPSLAAVMVNTFNITQDRIMRSRLAGDPPDVLVTLKVGKVGLFDFHRADELIAMGRAAVRRSSDEILELLEGAGAAAP
jgi:NTE family protein